MEILKLVSLKRHPLSLIFGWIKANALPILRSRRLTRLIYAIGTDNRPEQDWLQRASHPQYQYGTFIRRVEDIGHFQDFERRFWFVGGKQTDWYFATRDIKLCYFVPLALLLYKHELVLDYLFTIFAAPGEIRVAFDWIDLFEIDAFDLMQIERRLDSLRIPRFTVPVLRLGE
jgi:hypothetical protein